MAFPTTWHCVGMRRTAWKTARCLEDCDGLDVGWDGWMCWLDTNSAGEGLIS